MYRCMYVYLLGVVMLEYATSIADKADRESIIDTCCLQCDGKVKEKSMAVRSGG